MKLLLTLSAICLLSVSSSSQFLAKVEVKEDIPGICDKEAVYVIFPGVSGQKPAESPMKNAEIVEKLNAGLTYLKDHPNVKYDGMVNLYINCRGEMVKCSIDKASKYPELDQQIVDVFNNLIQWKVAKYTGNPVDSFVIYSVEIKKGKISIN